MKNLKKFLFILLTLALAISLFACGGKDPCKTHSDENEDGKCDKCGEAMKDDGGAPAGDVVLVENGEAKFQIVYADGFSTMLMGKVNKMKTELLGVGIKAERVADKADNVKDCEILIGNIATRGDKYKTDGHDYGIEGYVIKIIDSKIIINAGSEGTLIDAIDKFLEDIVEIEDDEKDFENLVMTADKQVEVIQDDYKVTSLAVGGKDMKGYTIALNTGNTYHMDAAKAIQETVYERTGYWFELVSEDKATDKSVLIKSVAKDAVDGGFKISASSKGQLVIECGYDNMAMTAVENFLSDKVVAANGAVDFNGTVYTEDISVVYYKDFGAKGDGRTDDFFALKAAHEFANISGQLVKAESGKTYYICETRKGGIGNDPLTIEIRTNVDWTGAKFIIDDTNISTFDGTKRASANIFEIKPDTAVKKITDRTILDAVLAAGLNRETTKIDLGLNEKVMIIPTNSSHKVYRRKGYGSFLGGNMQEVIVIDEQGNIDAETPVMFDYSSLDYIEVYCLSDEPITVEGGEFTTRASHIDIVYYENGEQKFHDSYVSRGIKISRSYTTMKNVKHYVTGEITLSEQKQGQIGTAYQGFFSASNANHVTLDGCVISGRRCYLKPVGGTTGTYGISAGTVNKIVFKNCVQQNFWVKIDDDGNINAATEDTPGVQLSMATAQITGKKMHWGCGGTNYCKNMEFIGSTLSRFDAHSGLMHGKIIDSTVNYIAITGVGDMIIKNSRWFAEEDNYNANSLIHLRADYGSIWDGKITIDGMKAYIFTHGSEADNYKGTNTWIFMHTYNNWYYGYDCAFPSIEINNLDYYDLATREPLSAGFTVNLCRTSVSDERALHLPETLKKAPVYPYVDKLVENGRERVDSNKDGVIDEKDGDGYVDYTNTPYDKSLVGSHESGITTTGNKNLNPIKPPETIKITGNDGVDGAGGYIFIVPNTAGYEVSDGGYYDDVENYGGFFGDTKFWYGDGENDYYLGTDYVGEETDTFKFIKQ
ncbi:MAG: hypothetical protein E7670_07675 [Ruminococcaceae bacterium]|nr:hypothetical protein [Oscillospiraceae bacterium]